MTRFKTARKAALAGPVVGADRLPAIAAIPLETDLQAGALLSSLDSLLQPGVSRRRDTRIAIEPRDIVRFLRRRDPEPRMRGVLERFLVALFFARRPGLFPGPDGAPSPAFRKLRARIDRGTAGPVPSHLGAAGPDIAALFRASLLYAGRDPGGLAAWDAARQTHHALGNGPFAPGHRGIAFARPPEVLAALADAPETETARARRTRLHIDPAPDFPDARPVCVIGVDRTYFDRYAPRLIRTARGIANLHFHVANPGEAPLPRQAHVRYSTEHVAHDPAYFASMRFLHLPELLAHYGRRLTTLDADAWFTTALTPYLDAFHGHELGLNINTDAPSQYFWRHYNAQILTAEPTDRVATILRRFARLFDALYTPGGQNWWIDQALLANVLHLAQREGDTPTLFSNGFAKLTGIKQGKILGA